MNNELKRCPFCGNVAEQFFETKDNQLFLKVGCKDCDMLFTQPLHTGSHVPITDITVTMSELTEQWNHRAAENKKDTTADLNIENASMDYRFFDDCVILHTAKGPVTIKREWFAKASKEVDKMYKESQMFDWIATEDGYQCDYCKTESRYAFKSCPNCGQKMRNGTE